MVRKKTGIPPGDPDYHAKYRELNREFLRDQAKIYRRTSPARLVSGAKIRAREKGLAFDISKDDILIPEKCPVLGIPLKVSDGVKSHNSPSIDRFTPELGYIKGNVFVVSDRANTLKSDGTLEEFEKIVEYLRRGQEKT